MSTGDVFTYRHNSGCNLLTTCGMESQWHEEQCHYGIYLANL